MMQNQTKMESKFQCLKRLESSKDIKGTKAMKLRLQAQRWYVLWQTVDDGRIFHSAQVCKLGCLKDRVNFLQFWESFKLEVSLWYKEMLMGYLKYIYRLLKICPKIYFLKILE